jgi:hypothetical protein
MVAETTRNARTGSQSLEMKETFRCFCAYSSSSMSGPFTRTL